MAKGDEAIQDIFNKVDDGIITFNVAVVKIQEKIYRKLLLFQKELVITNGTITNSAKNIKLLSTLKTDLESIIFDDTDFNKAIEDYTC